MVLLTNKLLNPLKESLSLSINSFKGFSIISDNRSSKIFSLTRVHRSRCIYDDFMKRLIIDIFFFGTENPSTILQSGLIMEQNFICLIRLE
jgi:hypothetical protein